MVDDVTRRRVLASGAAVAATPVLAACGDSGSNGEAGGTAPQIEPDTVIGSTGDVPVGGCAVFSDSRTVVTQPREGEFKAFGAVCPHEGCLVSSASEGTIPCRCHGSTFDLADGSVLQGPADAPLPAVEIEVRGDKIHAV